MPDLPIAWVVLAHLLRPQGRRGELLAELLTDFPERFVPGSRVHLAVPGFEGSAAEAHPVVISSSWLPHGRNEGRVVLGLEESASIEDAERLVGLDVIVPEADRAALTDGGVYIDALIGCTVFDRDVPIGTVRDVQFMTTPDGKRRLEDAAALLVVTVDLSVSEGREVLIPFAKDLLSSVDLNHKTIRMELPAGLLDLNGATSRKPQKRRARPSETTG